MAERKPVAVVTGANRGLGLETCRQLAAKGIHVILTARSDKGRAAAAGLGDEGLDVEFHPLDVADPVSVAALAAYVKDRYGGLDILVNNAGIFPDPGPSDPDAASIFNADADTVRAGFDTNTLGTLRVTQALLPLMAGRGCVVNVSSGMGQLSDMNGYCPGYRLSKTAVNAVTRIFADELGGSAIRINSVCPGWVRTDMGGPNADRDLAEGAAGIVWAATLDDDGPTGGFFRDGKPIPW